VARPREPDSRANAEREQDDRVPAQPAERQEQAEDGGGHVRAHREPAIDEPGRGDRTDADQQSGGREHERVGERCHPDDVPAGERDGAEPALGEDDGAFGEADERTDPCPEERD
jgi:hypothetical protein